MALSCCSQGLLEGLKGEQEEAWLVHFVDTEDFHDVELRKLPAMLGGIKVGVRHVTPLPPPLPRVSVLLPEWWVEFPVLVFMYVWENGCM